MDDPFAGLGLEEPPPEDEPPPHDDDPYGQSPDEGSPRRPDTAPGGHDQGGQAEPDGAWRGAVGQQLEALGTTVEGILQVLAETPAGGPWAWRLLDHDAAHDLAEELRDWVDWLIPRYQLGAQLEPCWYRHPPVLEELTALYVAWRAAYPATTRTFNDAPATWHDRCLWPVIARIGARGYFSGCAGGRHNPHENFTRPVDNDDFDAWLHGLPVARTHPARSITAALAKGQATALRPGDPTSPVLWDDTWWTLPTPNAKTWVQQTGPTAARLHHRHTRRASVVADADADPDREPAPAVETDDGAGAGPTP